MVTGWGVGRVHDLNICVIFGFLGTREARVGKVGVSGVITHEVCYRGVLGCLHERRAIPHIPGTLGGAELRLSP